MPRTWQSLFGGLAAVTLVAACAGSGPDPRSDCHTQLGLRLTILQGGGTESDGDGFELGIGGYPLDPRGVYDVIASHSDVRIVRVLITAGDDDTLLTVATFPQGTAEYKVPTWHDGEPVTSVTACGTILKS